MQVIWYNTTAQSYQYGSYKEFESRVSGRPNEILALERFRDASERTLIKIVSELNKCQLSRLR
ncbi:hypothetical protein [Ekhidna sp.]|uniref:hypothetical protein n=1 Tax=Ekhidna sp. TaxID=2608089 RepID=UPI0032986AFE